MKLSKRWIPSLVVPAVIAAGAAAIPLQASAVDLPDVTPQQLMLLMDGSVTGFSGTIVKTSDLGLPLMEMSSMMDEQMVEQIEEKMPEGFEDFTPQLIEQNLLTEAVALLAGTHKIRVYASEVGIRVQILDPMSQRDLIVNSEEFWIYDAKKATAITSAIETKVSEEDLAAAQAEAQAKLEEYAAKLQLDISSPEAVANYLMEMISEDTEVSVGKDHMVTGRTAYQLIAQPKAENSLIESVVISVDSETGMALDVSVYSVEKESPVFEVGFESISFEAPSADLFSFTPPPGTTVNDLDLANEYGDDLAELEAMLREKSQDSELTEDEKMALKAELEAKFEEELGTGSMPGVLGEGWESVAYLPTIPADVPMEMLENQLFADLLVQVEGGKVFSTPLMNILLTDSGEVYAGAVTISYLQEVAAR